MDGGHRESGTSPVVNQRTLKSPISCSGVALHSGNKVSMTLMPGEAGGGIRFKRTDVEAGRSIVPATWDHVVDTTMCTTVGNSHSVTVGTVEHLMAALAGCAIDNALIEIDGPEVPIMDGSAAPFVYLIECAEVVEQPLPRRVIRIVQPVSVDDGNRGVSLVPGEGFSLSFEIDFNNPAVSRQTISIGLGNGTFKKELACARTFGFLHEVETLRAAGLARGGSLDNAVVISGDKVLNADGLRYTDEFVRHKVLDAMGDLYLAGAPILGAFSGVCSGHAANNRLLHALFADRNAWAYETLNCGENRGGVWADDLHPVAVAMA